ncbi:hypothetical protein FACS1894109_11500 [Spirochaetia bacterium]|nr:hypothetical protein FACS1894109_11500 [Spirochaetia bacterium]
MNDEVRERLAKEIDRLTEENRSYVLGVSQALFFAQEAINRPEDISPCGDEQGGKKRIPFFFSKD